MDEDNTNCGWKGVANVKSKQRKDWILNICKAYVNGKIHLHKYHIRSGYCIVKFEAQLQHVK